MAKVIVADENEGRRTLLANTLEREGFDITRAGTLRQAEGTALAIMPVSYTHLALPTKRIV